MRKRLLIGAIAAMTLGGWYAAYQIVRFSLTVANELSRANDLTGIGPRAQTTIVLDRQGHPAFAFYAEQRIDVTLDQVSRHMVDAIVAVEDRRFYAHCGLDPVRIVGAAVRNVRPVAFAKVAAPLRSNWRARCASRRHEPSRGRCAKRCSRSGWSSATPRSASFRSISTPSISATGTTASKPPPAAILARTRRR